MATRRFSFTSPDVEAGLHMSDDVTAEHSEVLGLSDTRAPPRAGGWNSKTSRRQPRPPPLVNSAPTISMDAPASKTRRPTPIPSTDSPNFGAFRVFSTPSIGLATRSRAPSAHALASVAEDAMEINDHPHPAVGLVTPPVAEWGNRPPPLPQPKRSRRPESILHVASAWGISPEDAAEICNAVESVQSMDAEVGVMAWEGIPRTRRLSFTAQPAVVEEDGRDYCDYPGTPTTPLAPASGMSPFAQYREYPGHAPRLSSVTPPITSGSPLFSPGIFNTSGRFSVGRPDEPSPDFRYTSPAVQMSTPSMGSASVGSPLLFGGGSMANGRPEPPFPPTPTPETRGMDLMRRSITSGPSE
eukprot:m.434119 g.434119  ORF g.434119 m.434119 type:complete len:356 (+) comp17663_c0_seq1:296-1363(+)